MRYRKQQPKTPYETQKDADTQLLIKHGWVRRGQERLVFGYIEYWDHAEHPRPDGRWYTKDDAIRLQKALLQRYSPTLEEEE